MNDTPTEKAIHSLIRHISPQLEILSFAIALFDIAMIELGNQEYLSYAQKHLLAIREVLSSYLEVTDHD